MTTCTRCENTGFLNLHQMNNEDLRQMDIAKDPQEFVLGWIKRNSGHDIQVCDCCGDGEGWYGVQGEHYKGECQSVYDYNGGLCECH